MDAEHRVAAGSCRPTLFEPGGLTAVVRGTRIHWSGSLSGLMCWPGRATFVQPWWSLMNLWNIPGWPGCQCKQLWCPLSFQTSLFHCHQRYGTVPHSGHIRSFMHPTVGFSIVSSKTIAWELCTSTSTGSTQGHVFRLPFPLWFSETHSYFISLTSAPGEFWLHPRCQ